MNVTGPAAEGTSVVPARALHTRPYRSMRLGYAGLLPIVSLLLSGGLAVARPARVALLREAGFPTVDGPVIANATLDRALAGIATTFFKADSLTTNRLRRADFDVLVLPYGSAFPVDAWQPIREFLREGGGMVVLGGAPFYQPVRKEKGTWRLGSRQPTFAHELLLGPADALDLAYEPLVAVARCE